MALSTEKKVGLFFTLGLVILGILLELGQGWNPFEKNIPYKTYLGSTTGLKLGDSVRLAGVDVGKINKISLDGDRVRVDFDVKEGTRIKADTVASMRLTNLLGGQFLSLSFGSAESPILPPGSVVKSKDTANIDVIVDNMSDLSKDAKQLIADLNKNQHEVLTKISSILDENRGNLKGTLDNLNSISAKFDRGDGSLAMLLNDKTLYNNTRDLTTDLKGITAKINRGEGSLGLLVNDDSFYKEAKSAVANINDGMKDVKEIAGKINRGEGTIGKLVNEDTLYKDASETTKNLKEITKKINDGQGTLGRLLNEDKLYRDTTATLKKYEKAAEGLGDAGPISVLGSIIGTLF